MNPFAAHLHLVAQLMAWPHKKLCQHERGTSLQRCGDGDLQTVRGQGHFYLVQVKMVQHSVTRVLILLYDGLCPPVYSNYKKKRQKEIVNVHLVSRCKFVRKRQRLIKDLLHTVNYLFLNEYK